jgi:hypothetical protein
MKSQLLICFFALLFYQITGFNSSSSVEFLSLITRVIGVYDYNTATNFHLTSKQNQGRREFDDNEVS